MTFAATLPLGPRRLLVTALLVGGVSAIARAEESAPPPAAPAASAATLTHDLGDGLQYFRARELPSGLPPAATPAGPLVLDLRFATAQDGAVDALGAWLKFRASATTPVFVLLNASTAAPVRDMLTGLKTQPGLVTLGPSAEHFAPDLALATTAEEDKAAYDALDHGTALNLLLTENADKVRNDEASLARERSGQPVDPATTTPDADDPATEFAEKPPAPPPSPVDYTLQRAVQLHRALRALKRL